MLIVYFTLRSWVHEMYSPGLGNNYASKCSSDSFPKTKHMSPCVENSQNHALMFVFLQSWGEGMTSKENYGTDLLHSFFSISWPFSRDWRPTMHCDVVLTVFHTWSYIFCVGKIIKTTFGHIVVSQSRGDCSKMWENCMDPGSQSETYATHFVAWGM